DGRARRPRARRRDPAQVERAVRPPRRPAGAERLQRAVPLVRRSANRRVAKFGVVSLILATTGGHPYATQELCYALWDRVTEGEAADGARFEEALDGVLRSENVHFSRIGDRAARPQPLPWQALAREPLAPISSSAF